MDDAVRDSEPTCAAIAATPANINPDAVKVAPSVIDAATSPPNRIVTVEETIPSATDARPAIATATARRACLPMTPEAKSSARPESSSARLFRTTIRIAISAAKNPPSAPARQALKPSGVERSRAGPKMRLRAGLAPTVMANSARLAASGKIQG